MSVEITLPPLSESMDKGKIVKWFKKEGEQVSKDEPLYEVETDKATIQIRTPGSGVVEKIMIQEGEYASVGEVIAYMNNE